MVRKGLIGIHRHLRFILKPMADPPQSSRQSVPTPNPTVEEVNDDYPEQTSDSS